MKLHRPSFSFWILGVIVPSVAWASYSLKMGRYRAPASLVRALESSGVRVTEVCRSPSASYGSSNSAHHRCQAADLGSETTARQRAHLRAHGWCAQWHTRGTAPHWHVVQCGTGETKRASADRMRQRVRQMRQQHRGQRYSTRSYRPAYSRSWGVR